MDARRAALVEGHLALVEQVVLRVSGGFPKFVDRTELVGAGTLGLVEAALRFDFDRGIPFAGYAILRIRGAVLDVARAADWVPRSSRRLARDADVAAQELAVRHGEAPDDERVAQHLGIDAADLRAMREKIDLGVTRALDGRERLSGRDDDDQMVDRTASEPQELIENAEMHGYLRAALDSLPERLRMIVVGIYLENRTFEDLAALLGVTPSRISQLRSDAIDILRHGIDAQFRPIDSERPKGRVAIRQARFAADIARHSDYRTRLDAGARTVSRESMPAADVPISPAYARTQVQNALPLTRFAPKLRDGVADRGA